jgi:hypothetical protein
MILPLEPSRLAASLEWGFIAPATPGRYDEKLRLFPAAHASRVSELRGDPCVFALVPWHWVPDVDRATSPRRDLEGVEVAIDQTLPLSDCAGFYARPQDRETVAAELATYWDGDCPPLLPFDMLLEPESARQRLRPETADRVRGAAFLAVVAEIYGVLIKRGRISAGSRYIEPFAAIPSDVAGGEVVADLPYPGLQGHAMILALQAGLDFRAPASLYAIQEEAFAACRSLSQGGRPAVAVRPGERPGVLWTFPLAMRHLEELAAGRPAAFLADLDRALSANGWLADAESRSGMAVIAAVTARAIVHGWWRAGDAGALPAFAQGVSDAALSKHGDAAPHAASPESARGGPLQVALRLAAGTETFAESYYTVFNRAFREAGSEAADVFPVLGLWSGAAHGYHLLEIGTRHRFLNADTLERLTMGLAGRPSSARVADARVAGPLHLGSGAAGRVFAVRSSAGIWTPFVIEAPAGDGPLPATVRRKIGSAIGRRARELESKLVQDILG